MRGPFPPVAPLTALATAVLLLSLNACGGGTAMGTPPTVVPPLGITTTSLPPGIADTVYAGVTLQATGGVPPYTWAVTTGTLPSGLTLNGATAAISGTVAPSGGSSFPVIVPSSQRPPPKTAPPSPRSTTPPRVQKIEHV